MCEFQILVKEPGKKETLITEDISFLQIQANGSILLRGLGIQNQVDNAIIREVNTYAEDGATAKLFKASIIGDFLKFLKLLEDGIYSPELEELWNEIITNGKDLLDNLKKK